MPVGSGRRVTRGAGRAEAPPSTTTRGDVPPPRQAPYWQALPSQVAGALPIELRGFEHRRIHGVMKFHFGHPETHYEAWYHSGQGRVEVGLHFEGSRELNEAALRYFRARMVEVKGGLPNAELEPWDRGWTRLYETFPAASLDQQALAATARRVADYVITLQPLLEQFWSEQVSGPRSSVQNRRHGRRDQGSARATEGAGLKARERVAEKLTQSSASMADEPEGSAGRRVRRPGHLRRNSGAGH